VELPPDVALKEIPMPLPNRTYPLPNETYPMPDPSSITGYGVSRWPSHMVGENYSAPVGNDPTLPTYQSSIYGPPPESSYAGSGYDAGAGYQGSGYESPNPHANEPVSDEAVPSPPGFNITSLKRALGKMKPEDQALFISALLEQDNPTLEAQRDLATRLGNLPGHDPMTYGNIYHAANPLGAVVGAAGAFRGAQMEARTLKEQEELARRRQQVIDRLGGILME
jgi:hypothetical protein